MAGLYIYEPCPWPPTTRPQREAQPGHRGEQRRHRRAQAENYTWDSECCELGDSSALRNYSWYIYIRTFKTADPKLIGYGVGVFGWATGINLGNLSNWIIYSVHMNSGITVFALRALQIFAPFLRPNKDHMFRMYWNAYHHSTGYTIIIPSIVSIFKGITILDVEQKWKTGYIIVIGILGASF